MIPIRHIGNLAQCVHELPVDFKHNRLMFHSYLNSRVPRWKLSILTKLYFVFLMYCFLPWMFLNTCCFWFNQQHRRIQCQIRWSLLFSVQVNLLLDYVTALGVPSKETCFQCRKLRLKLSQNIYPSSFVSKCPVQKPVIFGLFNF